MTAVELVWLWSASRLVACSERINCLSPAVLWLRNQAKGFASAALV
jgi:hypothetical protein